MEIYPHFCDHEVVQKSPDDYVELCLCPKMLLQAWSLSLFAHELLNKDGTIKNEGELSDQTLEKYVAAIESIKRGEDIPKPVLGIGIMEGIEIGIGREVIAACIRQNIAKIPFNVRKAQAEDVKKLLNL